MTEDQRLDELCRLRSDLKITHNGNCPMRSDYQINKFIEALDDVIDDLIKKESKRMIEIKSKCTFIDHDIIQDNVIIGHIRLCPEEHEIVSLHIWEPYQNKGYGTQIIQMLIQQGYTKLYVSSDNQRAIHVYEKCGFIKGEESMFEMWCKGE